MSILSRKNDRLAAFIDSLLNAQDCEVVVLDEQYHTILYANAAAMRHSSNEALAGSPYRAYEKCFPTLSEKCVKHFESAENGDADSVSFQLVDDNGEVHDVKATKLRWMDSNDAVIIFLRNSNKYIKAQKELESIAFYDHLTAIPNRRRFMQDFQALEDKIADGKLAGCLAILDIDDFKVINDTYGHNTGDILLKRLVEHFCEYPQFKEHIYRLGGDEFLFFFADPPTPGGNLQQFFAQQFSVLSLSYSLPYIEKSCSTSIGIVLFPEYGVTVSELLRKADIALYKAKENGKNQIQFFDESLDTAKKFLDVYVNFQPILQLDNKSYGYELIDQSFQLGLTSANETPVMYFDRTIDMLQPDDLSNGMKYFIAFNMQLLSEQFVKRIPKKNLVVIIFGASKVGLPLLKSYVALKKYGYTVALERYDNSVDQRLVTLADIIKIDIDMFSESEHKQLVSKFESKQLIAKNVDTPEQFQRAVRMGYELFQGFYFCCPVVKKTKLMEPLKLNYLRLLEICSSKDELDMKEIASIISMDMALAYKLLRQLNNVSSGMRHQIKSIDLALNYLGEENLRKWVSLLALRGVSQDMPLEIVRLSMIRAKFAEALAPMFVNPRDPEKMFLHGLLSLLDVAMEMPFASILSDLALNEDIALSLVGKSGPYSDMVPLYKNYEYGNWDDVTEFANENKLSSAAVNDAYLSSVKWFNDQMSADGLIS